MRCGILIVGSLLWDPRRERVEWRNTRLRTDDAIHVKAPIYYGRLSTSGKRANTFTMTFASNGQLGQGVLVPCTADIVDVTGLMREARELWQAEKPGAQAESIGASWGCVGVIFRPRNCVGVPFHSSATLDDCLSAWSRFFRENASPISPVNEDGMLSIPWPARASDGSAVDVDVILATATKRAKTRPLPDDIANAWITEGGEEYFFENIRNGIRTPDDLLIWRQIVAANPTWLTTDTYAEAVAILRAEAV